MEQSQTNTTSSQKFGDELSIIYELIATYRNQVDAKNIKNDKRSIRDYAGLATVGVLIIIGALYAALHFLPPTIWGDSTEAIRLVLQFILLFIYIIGGAAILLQYISIKDIYKDFTEEIISSAAKSTKDEAALFAAFDELSTQSIAYVANRLNQASNQIGQVRSFLLGAVEKIGIIPGLLATVVAISKVADSTGISWIELISFSMLGFYMSMFPITEASIKTKRISVLMNQYLVLFRSSDDQDRSQK